LLKKFLSVSVVVLLLNMVGVVPAYAKFPDDAQARTQKVKEGIAKLGTGEDARVQLTLRDGRKLKGYIREAGQDTFVVVDQKTGTATTVAYPEVKEMKKHNGLPPAAKTGLKAAAVVGAGLGLSLLLVWALFRGEN
jgi:hypothetical protein